jgi:hypothetical protein
VSRRSRRLGGPACVAVCALVLVASPATRAEIVLQDATPGSGIDYRNVCGAAANENKGWIVEYMGAGAAWLDYNGDGHLDLYLVNGSRLDRPPGEGEPNRLYRGDGRGRFVDVTAATGTGDRGWGYGVAVGDFDNDGWPDLYVTNLGSNVLYRNRGNGTFEDVTARAGVAAGSWSTGAAFFDMEPDGDLDLYVARYVEFQQSEVPRRGSERAVPPFCVFRGVPVFCGPRGLPPAQDVMFRNNGDGTFRDVTRAAGMALERPRYGLGVLALDYDEDGRMDLFVANDSVVNSMWHNRGDGTFEDRGLATLTALDGAGNPQGCMGAHAGDFNGDGFQDIVVTNFSHDLNTVYRSVNGKFFVDDSSAVGMGVTTMELSWGTAFQDFDHDGDLDLFIANGHVYPEVDSVEMGTHYRQRNHVFENVEAKFREVSARSGASLAVERSWRGTAFGDYDADGDVDLLLTAMDAPAQLLRNDSPAAGHWIKLHLVGTASNRDGVGARVMLTDDGRRQVRQRLGGGSYLSASDPDLHFGLGAATRVERIQVRWPSGRTTELRDLAADRRLTITEE